MTQVERFLLTTVGKAHSKKKGRYTINKYRRYCIATDVIVFQQYNELYSKYNELYSKYNELYSKNKNWIANAIIVLIPPKKCKKNKKCIGKMAKKPSLFAVQLYKQKYNYQKNLDSAKKRKFSSP